MMEDLGMANRWAESYPADYSTAVERALFGLPHDYFVRGKAEWLKGFVARRRLSAETILDVGCGVGLLHRYLTNVTGVDVSSHALDEAAQRNPGASYRLYDGRTLPFPDRSFDIVLAVTVLHHVPPAQWDSFAREAARVARQAVVVIEHNPWNPLTRLSVARSELDHDAILLSARTTRSLLRNAGLHRIGADSLFFTAQYAVYGFR
jgi:SAM-dependent methyltransferase